MITNEITITYSEQYLPSRGINPSSSTFFDTETTGFKAGYSHLYLIGVGFRRPTSNSSVGECPAPASSALDTQENSAGSVWTIRQWMAERPQEETKLLRVFADFLKSFDTLLHFNGKRFDIPYLEEKYEQYEIPSPFTGLTSIDLYQDFKPLKSFLKLEHMNQKSLEVFLGLNRDDQYDGGKLIPVYRDYCKTGCQQKLHLLLLHNQEDVSGMLTLTSFYGYVDFFSLSTVPSTESFPKSTKAGNPLSDSFSDLSVELLENRDGTRNVLLTFGLKTPVPVPVSHSYEFGYITLNKNTGKLMLPMLEDTLFYFFDDYKNYYYLPQEDQAIHKSVAAYVDKQYRQQAKKENCYTRQSGLFLPQPSEFIQPTFRRNYKDHLNWFLWKEEEWTEPEMWGKYLSSLIRRIIS